MGIPILKYKMQGQDLCMTLRMRGGRLRAQYLLDQHLSVWPSRVGTKPFDPKYSPHLPYRDVFNFFGYATETCVHDVQGIACCKNALGTHLTLRKVRNVCIWKAQSRITRRSAFAFLRESLFAFIDMHLGSSTCICGPRVP